MIQSYLYSAKGKKELTFEVSLSSMNNTNTIIFTYDDLSLSITLKDIVDIEEFIRFLNRDEKKIKLYSCLKTKDKEYKGLRKIINKDKAIALSLGAMRFEFGEEAREKLLSIMKSIKSRI